MKVYSVNLDGTYQGVVAAKNKTQAAKLLGVSAHHMNNYGGQTRSKKDIEVAMKEPGVAWKSRNYLSANAEWVKL